MYKFLSAFVDLVTADTARLYVVKLFRLVSGAMKEPDLADMC